MARLDDQDIPPEYNPVYATFMGQTFLIAKTGNINVNMNQVARTRPPAQREPPNVPTPAQLRLRAAFTACQQHLGAMPRNEAHGYYNASRGTGYTYKHLYTHRNLGPIYRGTDPDDLDRPDCYTTEPEDAFHVPFIMLQFQTDGVVHLDYDLELDPGTFRHWSGHITEAPYDIYVRNIYDYGDYDVITPLLTFDPQTRTRYTDTIEVPPGEGTVYDRRVLFTKQVQELDRHAIAWQFDIFDSNAVDYGWYFTQWT